MINIHSRQQYEEEKYEWKYEAACIRVGALRPTKIWGRKGQRSQGRGSGNWKREDFKRRQKEAKVGVGRSRFDGGKLTIYQPSRGGGGGGGEVGEPPQ